MKMHQQNHHILFTINNFSAHYINYEPTNIQLEYFEPNLTSFVQPLNAGIIRCFKAHYRNKFCQRAIKLDEAGEEDIYKIDLKEAMIMVRQPGMRSLGRLSNTAESYPNSTVRIKIIFRMINLTNYSSFIIAQSTLQMALHFQIWQHGKFCISLPAQK
jgi:DDE superfamily endonuclease